jgi:putative ABC transport system substrate-binding protein
VVGFLSIASAAPFARRRLSSGLEEVGFVEGRKLVRRQVAVIVTSGGDNPCVVAKTATTTIPVVFNVGSDPVKVGLGVYP